MELGNVSVIVGLDMSSAFDTVKHSTLLAVLNKNFGVQDQALSWIDSYLTDRKVSVKVHDAVSTTRFYKFGVPQGSCLGPELFNVYTSTVRDVIQPVIELGSYAVEFHN